MILDAMILLNLLASFSNKKSCVHKSPTDSLGIAGLHAHEDEALGVMIIRDPRDVVCSHMRSTMPWTKVGVNKTVEGILHKLRIYWEAYEGNRRNIVLTKYENLHVVPKTVICDIWSLASLGKLDQELIGISREAVEKNVFPHPGIEFRSEHQRMGIVGDHKNHMTDEDLKGFYEDPWWMSWMEANGYEC